jgi:monoterpene epsilon-lactone hydrolase
MIMTNNTKLQEWLSEQERPSWQSRFFNTVARFLPIKQQTASAAAVQARVQKLALQPTSHKPAGLGSGISVILKNVAGWPVYYTAPSANNNPQSFVLFLHGGGYINEIVRAHWRFIGYLTRNAGVHCVVPIYPLVPGGTAKDIVPAVGNLLHQLLEDAGTAKVTVIGNSAGAGMGLAAAQWLRDNCSQQPDRLILISPGLDASINRPEQLVIATCDPIQDIPGIREGARLYAGDLGIAHPYVSPLNGSFNGLAPMTVFSGTLDLLYPDSIDLAIKARAAGVPVNLHLQRGQMHNFAVMPTPEGREARKIILKQAGI